MASKPNILYLHSHDTGRYIQPYGYAVPTPNIQKLAEQGVLFRQAFCANPTCSPSRASLLTGQWAHSAGMLGLTHRGFSFDYSHHLVQTLNANGYDTALSGMQHEAHDVTQIGYQELLTPNERHDHAPITAAACEFLSRPERQDKPFFLAAGFAETHRVFPPAAEGADKYIRPPTPIPDTPETRADMAQFIESARILDVNYGRILDALDRAGLADNTIVLCTTDHGVAWPGMKCNLTDHGIGVLMILRGPGGWRGGKVLDSLVSQIDVFPTLCELAGIDKPSWLQGKSLMPLIGHAPVPEIRDELFAEVNYHASYEPQRCVRTNRWKYIRRYGDRDRCVGPNCDKSPAKKLWIDTGWLDRPIPREQLFDLVFDPNEMNNLAADAAHVSVLNEMRQRLDRWMRETNDPLLNGEVPKPPGANITDPDALTKI